MTLRSTVEAAADQDDADRLLAARLPGCRLTDRLCLCLSVCLFACLCCDFCSCYSQEIVEDVQREGIHCVRKTSTPLELKLHCFDFLWTCRTTSCSVGLQHVEMFRICCMFSIHSPTCVVQVGLQLVANLFLRFDLLRIFVQLVVQHVVQQIHNKSKQVGLGPYNAS